MRDWLAVEAGIFAFLLLVALSSSVAELHGQSVANRLVLWGFVPLVLSIMLTALVLALPASPEMQPERLASFDMILGQSPRLMAAAELFQQLGNPYYYGNCQGKLSRLYAKTDQWEMSLQHALLAIQYAEQTQNPRLLEEGHHLAAEANLALKNYKTAADYFHLAWQEHNLLENEDVRRHITELRTQYEVARKQSEINALNIQKKEDEFAFFAAGLAAFLMLLLALAIFRHYRSAKRFARVSEAQKAELIAEIA